MTAATTTGTACRATAQRPLTPWEYLAALLPLEDLTHAAHGNRLRPAVTVPAGGGEELLVHSNPYDAAARTLYRTRRGNVLLTGRKGVGKTTFVRELARRAATGEIPFLCAQRRNGTESVPYRGWRFVWIDCRNVGPEDSRACLESIFTAVATTPDVILCLDGLAALLKRTHAGTNKPLLRAMLEGRTTKTRRTERDEEVLLAAWGLLTLNLILSSTPVQLHYPPFPPIF